MIQQDDTNLSLIVGHNGGHSGIYNNLLDKKLIDLKQDLIFEYGVDYMIFAENEKFINYLEEEINKVLKRMKKNYSKMSINNIYVID